MSTLKDLLDAAAAQAQADGQAQYNRGYDDGKIAGAAIAPAVPADGTTTAPTPAAPAPGPITQADVDAAVGAQKAADQAALDAMKSERDALQVRVDTLKADAAKLMADLNA